MNTETKLEAETNVDATEGAREALRRLGREQQFDEADEGLRQQMLSLIDIAPQDDLEMMLAVQLVAGHEAACACYRGGIAAAVTPDGFPYLNLANRLSRTFVLMLGAFDRHREKAPTINRNRLMRADHAAERKAKSAKQPSAAPSAVPEAKSAKQPSAAASRVPDVKSAKQPSGAQAPGVSAPAPASAPPLGNADYAKQPPKMMLAHAATAKVPPDLRTVFVPGQPSNYPWPHPGGVDGGGSSPIRRCRAWGPMSGQAEGTCPIPSFTRLAKRRRVI